MVTQLIGSNGKMESYPLPLESGLPQPTASGRVKPDCASVAACALSLAMLVLAEGSRHPRSPITLKAPSSEEGQANQERETERERSLVSPAVPVVLA